MVVALEQNKNQVVWTIISFVMDKYNANPFQKSRKRTVVQARRTAIHLLYVYTRLTVDEIGDLFGQDHTTVVHANKVIRSECLDYPEERERVIRDETEIECLLQAI